MLVEINLRGIGCTHSNTIYAKFSDLWTRFRLLSLFVLILFIGPQGADDGVGYLLKLLKNKTEFRWDLHYKSNRRQYTDWMTQYILNRHRRLYTRRSNRRIWFRLFLRFVASGFFVLCSQDDCAFRTKLWQSYFVRLPNRWPLLLDTVDSPKKR